MHPWHSGRLKRDALLVSFSSYNTYLCSTGQKWNARFSTVFRVDWSRSHSSCRAWASIHYTLVGSRWPLEEREDGRGGRVESENWPVDWGCEFKWYHCQYAHGRRQTSWSGLNHWLYCSVRTRFGCTSARRCGGHMDCCQKAEDRMEDK